MHVIILKKPRWRNIILWLVIGVVILSYRQNVISVFSGKLKPIYSANVTSKDIAITFDISWGEKTPIPILDILKQENIKATFFLSSPWAEKHEPIIKRMITDGHEIGSHGNRHVDLNTLSSDEIRNELIKAETVLERISGKKVQLLRPPNGAYDNNVIRTANEAGYQVIQWSVDSLDWKRPGPDAVVNNVLNGIKNGHGAQPGDIILFHASDSAPDTIKALPIIINKLKSKGYQLVPVSQLLNQASSTWPPESNINNHTKRD